jgi:mono/diheme cytochrome c family protein
MHTTRSFRTLAMGALALLCGAAAQAETKPAEGVSEEQRFFEEKCGSCHPSERIFLVDLTPDQRRHVVLRMRERLEAGSRWLSDEEVDRVLSYVDATAGTGQAVQPERLEDGKALFRERCKGCHELDRVYQQVKVERENPYAWMHVVTRMQAKNQEWISEAEAKLIVEYLQSRTVPKPRD